MTNPGEARTPKVPVIEREEVCSMILTHLKVPIRPEGLSEREVVYDVKDDLEDSGSPLRLG